MLGSHGGLKFERIQKSGQAENFRNAKGPGS